MNEKIKQFAINSQLVSVCDLRGTLVSGWQEDVDLTEYLEDFAEMIISECCVALHPMLRDMISRGQGVDLIRKHLGVKE